MVLGRGFRHFQLSDEDSTGSRRAEARRQARRPGPTGLSDVGDYFDRVDAGVVARWNEGEQELSLGVRPQASEGLDQGAVVAPSLRENIEVLQQDHAVA